MARKREEKKVEHRDKREISEGKGIAAFVLGLLSVIISLFIPYISLILAVLGIVFAVKQKKIKKTGLSKAGFILSIIGLVLSIIFIVLALILLYYVIPNYPELFSGIENMSSLT